MFLDILFNLGYLLIIAASIISLFFGLVLIFIPKVILKSNSKIKPPISAKEIRKHSKIKIQSEPLFYRYAKINGTALTLGSFFILYSLVTFNFYSLIPYFPSQLSPIVWEWLVHAGQIFFFICSSFILVFGLVVLFRPSILKNLETTANHWFSAHSFLSFMGNNIGISNKWLRVYPRTMGLFFTVFALFILFFLPLSH